MGRKPLSGGNLSAAETSHKATAFLITAAASLLIFYSCCSSDSDCDNGLFCDGKELCINLRCVAGTPPSCDDMVDCTKDSCDARLSFLKIQKGVKHRRSLKI